MDLKAFACGFFGCLVCLILINATSQIGNKFKDEQALYSDITNLYNTVQTRQFKVYTSTPNPKNLIERELVIVSTGTQSIFTKIATNTYSVTLTKQ